MDVVEELEEALGAEKGAVADALKARALRSCVHRDPAAPLTCTRQSGNPEQTPLSSHGRSHLRLLMPLPSFNILSGV